MGLTREERFYVEFLSRAPGYGVIRKASESETAELVYLPGRKDHVTQQISMDVIQSLVVTGHLEEVQGQKPGYTYWNVTERD